MSEKLLEVKDLCVEFRTYDGTVKAINHMTFQVPEGSTVGLVGETGAGKTTTALAIMGLVPKPPGVITSGSILFEGTDLLRLSESDFYEYRGKKIGMIFQNPMTSLNPVYTVGHQISDVIKKHQKVDRKEAWERAGDMLETVGIARERLDNYPHEFSGGMKQRVCIAMGLSCNPRLLIADEPTTALDVTIQAQILELMKSLKTKYKTSTIFITHALGVVAEIADYVVVVYAGSVIEQGTLQELFEHPLHPYTRGLFACLPDIEEEHPGRLHVIPGSMPDPMDLPQGCRFRDRCGHARDVCREKEPEDVWVNERHHVKCHLYSEESI